MSKDNSDLATARSNKADEFYTSYSDIEKEISCYDTEQFRDKILYFPCDGYDTSNFFKYFHDNFHRLHLHKIIATSYNEDSFGRYGEYDGKHYREYTLKCDGDFASRKCRSIMSVSDIVITNPPFSKFRPFIKQVMDMGKDFIILGNMNAVTYKEVFPFFSSYIKIGPSIRSGDRLFRVPDDYPLDGTACTLKDGIKYIRVKGVRWFTNMKFDLLPTFKLSKLEKTYQENEYQRYDTYPIINVNSVKDIPYDYDEEMGVPITAADKMDNTGLLLFTDSNNNIHKYKIKGMLNSGNKEIFDMAKPIIDSKCKFKRLIIEKVK